MVEGVAPQVYGESTQAAVAILVVSCDFYRDLWDPFFRCFFKYWPDCPYPIYLGSNTLTYSDARVRPLLVGPDVDYSSNLIEMLGQIPQDWVILWIEDRVLCGPVDTARVARLIARAQSQQLGYLKLIASHPLAIVGDSAEEIGEIPKGDKYRVCVTVALWNKQILLRLLHRGETAWQIERQGSRRSNEFAEGFYSISAGTKDNPPLSDFHLIVKGRLVRDARRFLAQEGLQDTLRTRRSQSLWSYIYGKTYLAYRDVVSRIRWWWRHTLG